MIDTLDNLKLALRVATTVDDDRLTQLAGAAEAFIAAHCGRTFGGGGFTEYFAGGQRTLFLANWPIGGVTGVKVDADGGFAAETLRPAAGYIVLADRGLIQNRGGPFLPPVAGARGRDTDFPWAVQVAYTTPTNAVPSAVQRAYADLVGHWYRTANTHFELNQTAKLTQTAGGTITAYPWGVSGGFKVPKGVLELLALYRVPVL